MRSLVLLALLGLVGTGGGTAWGQSVLVRSEARITGAVVRLGDVALLEGFSAGQTERLGQVELASDVATTRTIKAEQVLGALLTQDLPRETMLRLQVRGAASCAVVRDDARQTEVAGATGGTSALGVMNVAAQRTVPVVPEAGTVVGAAGMGSPIVAGEVKSTTLAEQLTQQVLTQLQLAREDVRVSFETVNVLLEQSVQAGQKWQIRPLNKTQVGTVQWEAQLLEKNRVLARLNVQAKVLQRRHGLVAVVPLARGDVLAAEHFREEERWVDRCNPAQQVTAKELIGLEALRPIALGAALDSRDFKPAELVARGQIVTVYAVSGGLKIKTSAKALQAGKLHEQISVQNDKTGDKLAATVIGRGVVVVGTLDEKMEEQLREKK